LIWKMKGTKSNRLLFQLAPKTLRTEEKEFGLLPTPSAMIVGDVDMQKLDERREREKKRLKNGNGFGKSLPELAKKGLLPTPNRLKETSAQTGKSSQLSPHFVGEMMGFPKDWTVSPFLSGEENPLKPTETQ